MTPMSPDRFHFKIPKGMDRERYSLFLLLSILTVLVMSAFFHRGKLGELIPMVLIYFTVAAASLELSQKQALRLPAILLAGSSMIALLSNYFYGGFWLALLGWGLLALFFGFAAVSLFRYLGSPGPVTNGRLYASVSLYFIIAILWFAIYRVIETVYPGSFIVPAGYGSEGLKQTTLLYLSLETLTTLGYGDILPVRHVARMFAGLEAATGVLYIAITVARLVSGYQRSGPDES